MNSKVIAPSTSSKMDSKVIGPPKSKLLKEFRMISNPFDMQDIFRGIVVMNKRINVMGLLLGTIQKQIIRTSDTNMYHECKYVLTNLGIYVSFNDTYITIRKQLSESEIDLFRLKKSITDIIIEDKTESSESKIKSFNLKIRVYRFNYKHGEQIKTTVYDTVNLKIGDNIVPHRVFDYEYANQCLKQYDLKMKIMQKEDDDLIIISYIKDVPKFYMPIDFEEILRCCTIKDSRIEFIKHKNDIRVKTYQACLNFSIDNNYTFIYEDLLNDNFKFLFIKN